MFVVHTVRGPLRFKANAEGLYCTTTASLAALSRIPVPSHSRPLVENARIAATRLRTDESMSARLAAFHRRADEGWDPNKVIPKNVAAVPD